MSNQKQITMLESYAKVVKEIDRLENIKKELRELIKVSYPDGVDTDLVKVYYKEITSVTLNDETQKQYDTAIAVADSIKADAIKNGLITKTTTNIINIKVK